MVKIGEEVISLITPDEEEKKKISVLVDEFMMKLNAQIKTAKLKAKPIVGGSYAKNTWISGVKDIDIFVKFDYRSFKDKSDKISDLLEPLLKKAFKNIERLHGSRDYFQIDKKGILFEIIPVIDVKDPENVLNITDMSLLHAEWVKKHAKKTEQIILAKSFFKAQDIYGAESYIQGFSGYSIELLTIHYKTFNNLLKNIAKWKPKTIIDLKKHHKDVMFELNSSKILSPLVLVDPVQPGRNVAAALSLENYEKMISASKNYIKSPSKSFFKKKEFKIEDLRKKAKGKKFILVGSSPREGKHDVVGCKLLKCFNFIYNKLILNDFDVIDKGWNWDKKGDALFWYIIKSDIPQEKEWEGPPLKNKKHVALFRKKHKKTFVKKDRVFAVVKRKHTQPQDMVGSTIKDQYIKEKVKSIRIKK